MQISLLLFFFNDTATTEIYTLSLHDALPISPTSWPGGVLGWGPRIAARASAPVRYRRWDLPLLGIRGSARHRTGVIEHGFGCAGQGTRRAMPTPIVELPVGRTGLIRRN